VSQCGDMFPWPYGDDDKDTTGCILPAGHSGRHAYVWGSGTLRTWEYDQNCTCEVCTSPTYDYDPCVIYQDEAKK
jgi:hypothetical protein